MSSIASAKAVQTSPTDRFFYSLTKGIDGITIGFMKVFRWVATAIMLLIVLEVTMRYVFRQPTIWNNDIQLYLSAGQRIIGIGYGTLHNQIIMDIFIAKLSFKQWKALELVHYFVFHLPLMFCLIWVTGARSILTYTTKEMYYSTWRPPLWPVLTFITFAYGLFVMQIFCEIIKDIISLQKGDEKWLKQR